MKSPWQIMTGADWLIVLALLATALAGIAWLSMAPAGGRVVATSGNQTCFVAGLDQAYSVDLEGPLGKTHLVIDEQGARITASPCPRKLCLAMGPAKHSGDLLACVPNQIMVRIDRSNDTEAAYDLLSR